MKTSLIILLLLSVEGLFASQDPDAVRKTLMERLERLQNISIDYRLTKKIKLSPGLEKLQKKGNYTIIHECGTLKFRNKFSYLNGKKRYDSMIESISEDGQYHLPLGSSETTTYLEDHVEYLVQGNNPTPTGYIKSQLTLPYYSGIEVGLGMRTYLAEHWITPTMIKEGDLKFDENSHAVLTWKDEKGRFHEWTFGSDLGYALTSYKILNSKSKNVMVEITMNNFKPISGIIVPYGMVMKSLNYQTGETFIESQFEVTEFRINDPKNVPALYKIAWPEGTAVIDERTKLIQIVLKNGQLIDAKKMGSITQVDRFRESEIATTKPSCHTQSTTQTHSIQKTSAPNTK